MNRIEYVRDGVERRFPYCDYEMLPDSEWNYGFYSEAFEVMFEPVTDTPFSVENPPIRIKAKMVPVPWEEKGGICAISPTRAQGAQRSERRAAAALRMHEPAYDGNAVYQTIECTLCEHSIVMNKKKQNRPPLLQ